MDVSSGTVRADSPVGDGGGDECSGSLPSFWSAPGYGAQDAGLLGATGLPAAAIAPVSPIGPYTGVIDAILEADAQVPRKQRHTAKRIFERLLMNDN